MDMHKKILRTLDKARLGTRITEKEWDQKVVPRTVAEVVKEFGLQKTCDPSNPVNTDMELADTFFKAGWELALRLGFFCPDTETVIKVDADELAREFKKVPGEFKVGKGREEVTVSARKPSDGKPPVYTAPLSIQMNEELYVPLVEGILSSRLVDMQEGPSLDTVMGSRFWRTRRMRRLPVFMNIISERKRSGAPGALAWQIPSFPAAVRTLGSLRPSICMISPRLRCASIRHLLR